MKRLLTIPIVLISFCLIGWMPWTLPAQGSLELTLTVKDSKGRAMYDTEVEFIETTTRQRILATTNKEGELVQSFSTGRYWQMNIKDIRNYYYWQVEVPPNKNMRQRKTITYSFKRYERETRPKVDRSKLNIQRIVQKNNGSERADAQNGIVKVTVKRASGSSLPNFEVELTSYKLRKTFVSKTNPAGTAYFKVPLNHEYELDIDGIESFNYVDIPNVPRYTATKGITYEPTIIEETNVNDTITQKLPQSQKGTSGAVMTSVTLKGGPDKYWRDEPVFLEILGEKKWYRATTNAQGSAHFLLPKGKAYMIHGRFEFDLDVLDYSRRRGIGYSNKTVLYRPRPEYQFPDKFIPKPEELIVDAFRDFLHKRFPLPMDNAPFGTHAEFSPINANSKEALLRLGFSSPDDANVSAAPPMNVCFVIDKSGSMAGHERIGNLKESLQAFTSKLRTVDVVSLVLFESFETVVMPAQKLGDGRERLQVAIRNIEAEGGTNIYKGMLAGYRELMKNFKKGRTNRLILLTDGYGITPVDSILMAQAPFNEKGVEVSCVGVGTAYNYALLKQLAANGGGLIEHVGEAADLKKVFMEQLSNLLFPVATDVEVTVTYNKHLVYKQLYGFPVQERGNHRLRMKIRNVYAGSDQMAFLRFSLPAAKPEIAAEPVIVHVKYKDLMTGEMRTQELKVPLKWKEGSGDLALAVDEEEKKIYAIAVMNQSLKVMSEKFHAGDAAGAKAALMDGLANLDRNLPATADEDLRALKQRLEKYLDVISRQ